MRDPSTTHIAHESKKGATHVVASEQGKKPATKQKINKKPLPKIAKVFLNERSYTAKDLFESLNVRAEFQVQDWWQIIRKEVGSLYPQVQEVSNVSELLTNEAIYIVVCHLYKEVGLNNGIACELGSFSLGQFFDYVTKNIIFNDGTDEKIIFKTIIDNSTTARVAKLITSILGKSSHKETEQYHKHTQLLKDTRPLNSCDCLIDIVESMQDIIDNSKKLHLPIYLVKEQIIGYAQHFKKYEHQLFFLKNTQAYYQIMMICYGINHLLNTSTNEELLNSNSLTNLLNI